MSETTKQGSRLRWVCWLAVPLAAALLFTACGDDEEEPAAPAPAAEPEPAADPEPESEPAAEPEPAADPEPEPEPAVEPEPAAEPEPEPEPAAPPEPIDIRLVTWGGGKFIDFIDL